MKNNQYRYLSFILSMFVIATIPINQAEAVNTNIQTDSTLSGITAFHANALGSNHTYTLSEINGKTAGNNLFFSFSNFNIGATDIASFELNTPNLANVISRITGGSGSVVEGKLTMTNATGSAPSFFLINPAGITFSPGASIDVPGSFYTSTASTLNFSDGSKYIANETQTSMLSSANPESFGFLGNETGNINIGNLEKRLTNLVFKPGTEVAIVGNNIQIENAAIQNADNAQATGLYLQLITTGKEATNIKLGVSPNQATSGELILKNANLNVSNIVEINAHTLEMDNSYLTNTYSGSDAGRVEINANELIINSSFINTEASNIILTSDYLEVTRGNISSISFAKNNGHITIKAEQSMLLDQKTKITNAKADKSGSGDIDITADYLKIENESVISSGTANKIDAGDVKVTANTIILASKGQITSSSSFHAKGQAGSVKINGGQLELDGGLIQSSAFSNGDANTISIAVDTLGLQNGSIISSATIGENLESKGGNIDIKARLIENMGKILSNTSGAGASGDITMHAEILKLNNNGFISSGSGSIDNKYATGAGGLVKIEAGQVEIGNAFIISDTFGSGEGGKVEISASSLHVDENGFIRSTTYGLGKAGEVSVTASSSLIAQGTGDNALIDLFSNKLTGIFSNAATGSSGQTGNIKIEGVHDIQLRNGAQISIENDATVAATALNSLFPAAIKIDTANLYLANSNITAESKGNVDAGSIHIHYSGQLFLDPSTISTAALNGDGGAIAIEGGDILFLQNSAITTSVGGKSGDGGNIDIAVNGLILDSGYILANTAASGAKGGGVNINTPAIIPSGNSLFVAGNTPYQYQPFSGLNVIQAAAPDGVSGTITADKPQLNLSGMLANLIMESFDSNALNRNMCTVEEGSSFLHAGKGGMPMRAKDFLLLPTY